MLKGKANTAHCLRFPGDWFHVFGIGQRSIGFSVRIEVKTGTKVSEVVVGPENRTAISNDNFLRVNLIGDYAGYSNIPSFDNFYLVIPRQGSPGQPQNLGRNFSMWMLLERVRFTLDGLECNKIGVSYEAFTGQPDFCSAPFWSCLHNQLWNFWDADQNRIRRKQVPLYGVHGRFERINEHPNAGSHSFSIGITEVLNTNLLIELSADDIEYVYQRSPGKILGITVPTFEALTQSGTATVTTENIGEVEASYSLTFHCSEGVGEMEEQFYIMKPKEVSSRSFKLYPASDQAAKYVCSAILKDSDFHEVDRAECQFMTTATVLENGTQLSFHPPKTSINRFFESFEELWKKIWDSLLDFITGRTCRMKCSGFFDFRCHIQYICMSWMAMFGLLLAMFPAVIVLLWLLHQKGLFDPLYDWWEDHVWYDEPKHGHHPPKYRLEDGLSQFYAKKHRKKETKHHKNDVHRRRRSIHHEHRRSTHREHRSDHKEGKDDFRYYLHHVNKDNHKLGRTKGSKRVHLGEGDNGVTGDETRRKERDVAGDLENIWGHGNEHHKHKNAFVHDRGHRHLHVKRTD